jgi:hypothetical protein
VAAHHLEHGGGERHQKDVARFAGDVRHHAREDEREREHPLRGREHQQPQRRPNEPAAFRNADAEHGDQHGSKGGESREVRDGAREQPMQPRQGQQAARDDGFLRARVRDLELEPGGHRGQQRHHGRQRRKQRRRVRQRVSGALDKRKRPLKEAARRGRGEVRLQRPAQNRAGGAASDARWSASFFRKTASRSSMKAL